MFLNPYQKYIDELINEYGPLYMRQLVNLVNAKFKTRFATLNGYVAQMERYYYYERNEEGCETLVYIGGMHPDYNIIRSMDVMLHFINQVIWHRKSGDYVSIRFYVDSDGHTREVSVIPVNKGSEKRVSDYVNDKVTNDKSEVVMYLLDDKSQIRKITSKRYQRFAYITENGVVFYKSDK